MLKQVTVYLNTKLHQALKKKAARTNSGIPAIIREAIYFSFREDAIDLEAIKERAKSPVVSYKTILKNLKRNGLLTSRSI